MTNIKSKLKETAEAFTYQRLVGIIFGCLENPKIREMSVVQQAKSIGDCIFDNFRIKVKIKFKEGDNDPEVEKV